MAEIILGYGFAIGLWQRDKDTPSFIYLSERLAIFITFFIVSILSVVLKPPEWRLVMCIYLTYWGLWLCLLQSFMSCILLVGAVVDDCMNGKYLWRNKISKMYSIYWVLNIIATPMAFAITIVYWTLIFKAEGSEFTIINFMIHGLNSILMLIDFWTVSHPVHLLHFVYPIFLSLLYLTMTLIFYIAGGTIDGSRNIYPILKWGEPGPTIGYGVGVLILVIILHMLTFVMYKIRSLISSRIISLRRRDSLDI